jgi:HEPN domain-containing protein
LPGQYGKEPAYWLALAARDAESAEILMKESGPAEISAYHFHQAAEKLLKGAILEAGQTFPFIHDLQRLYGILRIADSTIPDIAKPIVELQLVYGDLRYPKGGEFDRRDLERIREAWLSVKASIGPK